MIKSEAAISIKQIIAEKLDSGVALVYFDGPGKANYLTQEVVTEFERLLSWLETEESVIGVGLLSRKPDNFLLGADLREIMKLDTSEAANRIAGEGQRVFSRFANLNKPKVAGIHGICLGGGLELALCCNRRIATGSYQTQLGLPEVKLGFVPGLGGTQRLPRLLALKNALDLIITAEPIDAEGALKIGLVDEVVSQDKLSRSVEEMILALLENGQDKDFTERAFHARRDAAIASAKEDGAKKQEGAFAGFRRAVRIKTKGRYPAHARVLDVIQFGLDHGIEKGLSQEAKAFAELAVSDISRNLVSLYFSTEFARSSALSGSDTAGMDSIKTVGIIGGGLMGVSLSKLAAREGVKVLFRPLRKETLLPSVKAITEALQKASSHNLVDGAQMPVENFHPIYDDRQLLDCDLIFEATEENIVTKVRTFKSIKPFIRKDCILATITSSLTVQDMQAQLGSDNTLIGTHFFHPVEKMPLVEISSSQSTDKLAAAKVAGLVGRLNKIPVLVKDVPCFLVNRLLCCYLLEAARLCEERVPLDWLEETALEFGMPMGPLDLLDEVGLDTAIMVAETLHARYGERILLPPVLFKVKSLGIKGKKAGVGIYRRDATGKKTSFDDRLVQNLNLVVAGSAPSENEASKLCARMILPMVDEAARCLEEKIVRRPRDIDLATVLGIGFPAFRGGLLKYGDTLGSGNLLGQLTEIYALSSPHREVSNMIKKLAKDEGKFYAGRASSD